jgi:hypothetical protein
LVVDGVEVDDDVVRVIKRSPEIFRPSNPVTTIDWNVEERRNTGMGAGHTAPWFYGSIKVSGHGGRHDDVGAVQRNRLGAHDRFNVAGSGANA